MTSSPDSLTNTAQQFAQHLLKLYPQSEIRRVVLASATTDAFRAQYRHDPVAFVHDCFAWQKGQGPTDYQCDILAGLVEHHRAAVRGPHALGKSALASWVILWLALTWDGDTDWKIGATAGSWFQLQHYLFPELHKWAQRIQWHKIGRPRFDENELLVLRLRLQTGEAYAFSSDRPELIEGQHGSRLAQIYDESKAIADQTFDATEGAFASPETAECYALAISTPGAPEGRFYDIHARKPGYEDWWTRHVTLDEAIRAGRISRQWAEQRAREWGEGSAVYQNRVLGEFAADSTQGIIPLTWVEQANERWREWDESGQPGRVTHLGVDVGGGEEQGDHSVIAVIVDGHVVSELRVVTAAVDPSRATMELAGQVAGLANKHRASLRAVCVDVQGIGAGVGARLAEQGYPVVPFVASRGTGYTDSSGELGFANWRAAGWWMLREALDPGSGLNIALPPDDTLTGELTAPTHKIVSGGRIQVEEKASLRRSLKRSTDRADAVIHALIGPALAREQTTPKREVVWRGR